MMASGFPVALKDDPADSATMPHFSKDEFTHLFYQAYETRRIPVFWQNLARKKKMTSPLDTIYALFCEISQEVQTEFRQNKKQDYRLAKLRPGHMALMVALTDSCDEKDLTKQKIKRRLKNAMRLTLRSSVPAAENDSNIDAVIINTMSTRMDELLDEKRRPEKSEKKRRIDAMSGSLFALPPDAPGSSHQRRREVLEEQAAEANLKRQMLLLARATESFSPEKVKVLDERASEFLNAYFEAQDSGSASAQPSFAVDCVGASSPHDTHAVLGPKPSPAAQALAHASAMELTGLPLSYGALPTSVSPPFPRSFPPVMPELAGPPRSLKHNGKQ